MAPTHSEKILVPITLRIPGEIHGRLKKISEVEYRSLNHQIIMALACFVELHEKGKAFPTARRGGAR
ncbi:MAG: hypothetical protein HY074_14035 [Deltaproteobacteria bacterium]|nr:hypothetical protein [Deltaproteobacteria bacterium]